MTSRITHRTIITDLTEDVRQKIGHISPTPLADIRAEFGRIAYSISDEERDITYTYKEIMKARNLTRSKDIYDKIIGVGIDEEILLKMKNNPNKKHKKETIFAFCIIYKTTFEESVKLFSINGHSLNTTEVFDVVSLQIIYHMDEESDDLEERIKDIKEAVEGFGIAILE